MRAARRGVLGARLSATANPLVWVAISAFAPYLIRDLGVRIEHVAIYVFGMWGLSVILLSSSQARPPGLFVVTFFVGSAVVALLVTLLGSGQARDALSLVSELDHYLRPAALALGIAGWATRRTPSSIRTALQQLCVAILALLTINTFLSLAGRLIDIGPLVAAFRSARTSTIVGVNGEVAFLDFESFGRVTGIFGLPFDAGVAYTMGLLAWVYIVKTRRQPVTLLLYFALALLVVGGLLPVSKAFLIGGLPLFVIYWMWGGQLSSLFSTRLLLAVAAAVVVLNTVLAGWVGLDSTASLFADATSGRAGIVETATAGRFGTSNDVIGSRVEGLLQSGDFLFGVGLGTPTLLDNAYYAFLVQGGILLVAGYVSLIVWLAISGWRVRNSAEEGRLLFVLMVFVAGAGMGAPVVSVVRSSTILWLLALTALATALSSNGGTGPAVGPIYEQRPLDKAVGRD